MGLFEHFPYTNFHELNLDWILEKMKELEVTNESLENKILDILNDWKNDGTLSELINKELFNNINGYVSDITQSLANVGIFTNNIDVIRVGSGKDYTSLVDAVHSCNPEKASVILLDAGTYDISDSYSDNEGYGLTLDNIFIIGIGTMTNVVITSSGKDPSSVLCLKNNSGLYNLFITGYSQRYTIHDDFHNRNNTVRQFRHIVDCQIYGQNVYQVYGSGIKSNQEVLIKNCFFYGFDCDAFRMHNFTGVDDVSTLILDNCTFVSGGTYKANIILGCLDDYSDSNITAPVKVVIKGGNINYIRFINELGVKSTVNPFVIYCDHQITVNDDTGLWRYVNNYVSGVYVHPVSTTSGNINTGTVVIRSSIGDSVQILTTGSAEYAAYGVSLNSPYDNKCLILTKGIIPYYLINTPQNCSVFDKITIGSDGQLMRNGTGRVVGYLDAQSQMHFDFESM